MTWALTAITVATVSTVASVSQGRQARKDQRRANEVAQKSAKLESTRGAVEQVRQAQIARASVLQQGENAGVSDSSVVAGATGSIQFQAGGNIGFANAIFGLQQSRARLLQSAASHQGRASDFGQLASLATTAASFGSSTPETPEAPTSTGIGPTV